jgi:hypothetical protein
LAKLQLFAGKAYTWLQTGQQRKSDHKFAACDAINLSQNAQPN